MAVNTIPTNEPNTDRFDDEPKVSGSSEEIVRALETYRIEADANRKGGMNPRDDKWRDNLNSYWGRMDFSKKAHWQAKENMAEVSSYVDRFAAALKEALVSTPQGFYTVSDPADKEQDMSDAIKRMTDVWLSRAGRNQMGQPIPFSAVFEEQVKLGALTAMCSVVTWKEDMGKWGRVAIETVDPRQVFLDHTYRNLYRVRRIEMDRQELAVMAKAKDSKGEPIFNLPEVSQLVTALNTESKLKEELTGHGQQIQTGRSPVVLDEYIATVVDAQGEVIADRALMVVANNRFLVRGPEKNPFWHGNDWLVYTPLVTTPLSVYGRSYMEDFGSISKTFNELTNLILDAVHTTALKNFVLSPGMLIDPTQVATGVTPNKVWLLEDGYKAEDFMDAVDMGTLSPDAVRVWEAMKNELGEAAGINEIGLGQFAPKGRTSATEIMETKQSSSALIRSVAQTIETRWLDPTLDLAWKTGLQNVSKNDLLIQSAIGDDMFAAIWQNRKELVSRPITFQARGISQMIQNSATLKALVGVLQLMSASDVLLQEFLKQVSLEKLVQLMFQLSGVDLSKIQLSQREQMMRSLTEPMQAAQQNAQGAAPPNNAGSAEMAGLANTVNKLAEGNQKRQMKAAQPQGQPQ